MKMMKRRRPSASESMTGQMINMGIGNLVGVGMIGATAGMVGSMPAGMAKDIAGVVPGLQSVALMGNNVGYATGSMGRAPRRRVARRRR